MFVYSVRGSDIKFFAIVILSVLVVAGLVFSGNSVFASAEVSGEADFSGIKTKDDRIAFLAEESRYTGKTVVDGKLN